MGNRTRIEEMIENIEDYIGRCKTSPFSASKIIVGKEEIEELLTELKLKTPDEIKRYQKIINNKEAILADAQAKADALIAQATVQTNELVSEHEIMQQAYAQANEVVLLATKQAQEILDNATIDANNIRMGAIQYTDDMLANLEGIISHAIDINTAKYENLIKSLQSCYDIVNNNRTQLAPQDEDNQPEEAVTEEDVEEQE